MPVNAEDGGAYRLLDMFAHPPDGDRGMERERDGERGREGGSMMKQ